MHRRSRNDGVHHFLLRCQQLFTLWQSQTLLMHQKPSHYAWNTKRRQGISDIQGEGSQGKHTFTVRHLWWKLAVMLSLTRILYDPSGIDFSKRLCRDPEKYQERISSDSNTNWPGITETPGDVWSEIVSDMAETDVLSDDTDLIECQCLPECILSLTIEGM